MKKYKKMYVILLILIVLISGCGKYPVFTLLPDVEESNSNIPTLNIIVFALDYVVESGTLTISQGTIPKIAWSYVGSLSGDEISISVQKKLSSSSYSGWWSVSGISPNIKSVTYGESPAGSTTSGVIQSLTTGEYNVVIWLSKTKNLKGLGIGTLIVQ